ncbi:hypothetical protein JW960_02505 [candidate division KSB1 bacterium]|nr:hypothetical protein [candidate division KSB1 bacterium]
MANVLLQLNTTSTHETHADEESTIINLDSRAKCCVYGKQETFTQLVKGDDAIILIGYTCHIECESKLQTLTTILDSFDESQIVDLKMNLVGQFVILIKKNNHIYLFTDFISSRNIFYSITSHAVSSSFTKLETFLQTTVNDLDENKIFEFLSMRYVIFPGWLGQSTKHKRIKWLLPYEYLTINLADSSFRVTPVVYSIDNNKESDCARLAIDLIAILKFITRRKEFKDSLVAASLTGGRDTRLVAAVAADYYSNIKFRIAVSSRNANSVKDLKVARRVAKARGIPLDVYYFQTDRDEERFYKITEGLTPAYNHSITPLIESSQAYALGFGGAFGSQLFWPIKWTSIPEFIEAKLDVARKYLFIENGFWDELYSSLLAQFQKVKDTFRLSDTNDMDYIRLFQLLQTARYSSFIMSAYNRAGYQLEPYGSYAAMELALRVPPVLWGNHKKLCGDCKVQTMAMAILNPDMGKIITYASFRPMVPLSVTTYPRFMIGYVKHHVQWLSKKMQKMHQRSIRTNLTNGYHISDGWDNMFINRTMLTYGLSLRSEQM